MKSYSFLLLLLSTAMALPALAQKTDREIPDWMQDITRTPPGKYADLRPVRLEYTLSWNNRVNAGRVNIQIAKSSTNHPRLIGEATGGSTGFARAVWPYDFRARSVVDYASLRPITFQLSEREKDSENSYDIIFEQKRQIYNTRVKKKDEEMKSGTSRFRFDFGQDVLSSAFYLRSQPLLPGDEISMIVTPYNKPYLAKLKVIGKDKHTIKGKTYDAIKLDAVIGKINPDMSLKAYEKVKKSTLWLQDDQYRLPLELQTEISVGFISARLDEMKWIE